MFLILLGITLVMFGIPMVLLNFNRSDDNKIVQNDFSYWGVNMFLNQYKLILGEFDLDNFAGNPQAAMCYGTFILATFIT